MLKELHVIIEALFRLQGVKVLQKTLFSLHIIIGNPVYIVTTLFSVKMLYDDQ